LLSNSLLTSPYYCIKTPAAVYSVQLILSAANIIIYSYGIRRFKVALTKHFRRQQLFSAPIAYFGGGAKNNPVVTVSSAYTALPYRAKK